MIKEIKFQIEPKIIFSDDQLFVLDKPTGWLTHPSTSLGTSPSPPAITEWLITKYPELEKVGPAERLQDGSLIPRAGILHRLDRETSGVLAVARTTEAFAWFTQAFRERTVEKVYRAIVTGAVKADNGVIDLPIARSRQDPRRRVASPRAKKVGREAVTHYEVLERFPEHTYLELRPKTGRTHQLRAHLKAINAPILGDTLYSPKSASMTTINRTALHAFSLTLPLQNGERQKFESPLPLDFSQTLDHLREV